MSETEIPEGAVDEPVERAVTPFELFFDLVFVFGFTQVTALMAAHPSGRGVLRGMLVLAAVWWAWGAYAWLATTINLEEGSTRLVMIGVMGAMFVAALAAPYAFSDTAVLFACAYLIVRILHLVLYAVAARGSPELLDSVVKLTPTSVAGPLMILAAAFVDSSVREAIWAAALLLDFAGPLFQSSEGWQLSPGHFSERHGLIFIVALGESVVALGVGGGQLDLDARTITAATLGIAVVTAMWWMYFDVVAIVAARRLAQARGAAQAAQARDSYSYLHYPMVAGVILFALGVKKALPHAHEPLHWTPAAALCGGVALYLIAHILFRLRNVGTLNRQRLVAAVVVACMVALASTVSALVLLALVAATTTLLVAYEAVRFREARRRVRAARS
ncbi:MAG TPA: low temperature requirement protein A [Gaiellales bacterium]|nr:low temperature requirement protein A [Gaiellales bacterium]